MATPIEKIVDQCKEGLTRTGEGVFRTVPQLYNQLVKLGEQSVGENGEVIIVLRKFTPSHPSPIAADPNPTYWLAAYVNPKEGEVKK